jgi:hypothetical protein
MCDWIEKDALSKVCQSGALIEYALRIDFLSSNNLVAANGENEDQVPLLIGKNCFHYNHELF